MTQMNMLGTKIIFDSLFTNEVRADAVVVYQHLNILSNTYFIYSSSRPAVSSESEPGMSNDMGLLDRTLIFVTVASGTREYTRHRVTRARLRFS